jgi:exonuclease VII small subunit
MTKNSSRLLSRRTVLGGIAGGASASLAGCSLLDGESDAGTNEVDDERARALAERFAPTLYFDQDEQWFPTDPRPYESDQDGDTVVDGFDALDGYVEQGGDDPPETRAFYHVVEYEESPLEVVEFWFYSVFDQFTANFHWHDWELLQVFVDSETEEPQLYVASAHSRSAPNNEFLDPDPELRPRVLVELGSHSSGLSVNDEADRFQRFPLDGGFADITNSAIDGIEDIVSIPVAYGLPRDEGLSLPYAVPELDGAPLYEHDRLPAVDASDLVDEAVTVRSFEDLRSPPTDLPSRETGLEFDFEGRDGSDADVTYDLVPTTELEHIEDFTGPQLSFEFAIPEFAEDLVAGHITTTGVPWKGPRYEEPATDITEATHRQALSERYDAIAKPAPINRVIAGVTNAVSSDDAPEDEGLTTVSSSLEMFALLQSDPEAVPTFQGVAVLQDVPEGEHTFTINGAGVAPHSETVRVSDDGEPTVAGVDGEIPVVAQENATKVEVDPSDADSDLSDLAVEDDFAGRMYDAPLSEPDAVYVHRGGAYTTEVVDTDGEIGAFRVNPDEEERVRIDEPRTGKASLATYLADVAEETQAQVAAVDGDDDDDGGQSNAVRGLAQALEAVSEAGRRAAENAASGSRENADRELETVISRLERVETRLQEARGELPEGLANASDNRLEQAGRRAEQAQNADKL